MEETIKTEQKFRAPHIYVKGITFNDGTVVNIRQSDIIIIVGANNSGKSQSLLDIQNCAKTKTSGIVIQKIDVNYENGFKYDEYFAHSFITQDDGRHRFYHGLGFNLFAGAIQSIGEAKGMGDSVNIFLRRLTTDERLAVCQPPPIVNINEQPTHPIHLLARNPEFRKKVTKRFKEAFGCELIPDIQYGKEIPLRCVDVAPDLTNFSSNDELSRQDEFYREIRKYPTLDRQGDGMRGFAGVLLNLILDYVRTYLIDEPESFLHPPQARIIGNLIGEILDSSQQAFIATHSEEIIRGLIQSAPDRVRVIRLERIGKINRASVLDPSTFTHIWGDPLLRYSNIMAGMFHTKTVVCEGDADCQFYSAIDAHIKQKNHKYPEALYVYSGGKSKFPTVIRALRSLKIDYRIIGDIDVLNDERFFSELCGAAGINWDEVLPDYHRLSSNLRSSHDRIGRDEAKEAINDVIKCSTQPYLEKKEIEKIRSIIKVESKWELLKLGGISVIPAGEPTQAWEAINKKLREAGVFLLPNGEIENFVKNVGGLHGPGWVEKVLSQYPDLDNEVYIEATRFVSELGV